MSNKVKTRTGKEKEKMVIVIPYIQKINISLRG